jgi:hypothetical protein
MSTSWLLGNVYTAKSCKGEKRVREALKLGLVSYGRQPRQKTSVLQDSWGLGVGLTTPSQKKLIVQKPCEGCRTDLGRRQRKRNRDKDMMLATWNDGPDSGG